VACVDVGVARLGMLRIPDADGIGGRRPACLAGVLITCGGRSHGGGDFHDTKR
jgi:hypothetical protein